MSRSEQPMRKRIGMQDTDAETRKVMNDLARATPVWKKFAQVSATTEGCLALARAGIKRRYPNAADKEIRLRLAAITLGRETVKEVYGWAPDKEVKQSS